MSQQPDDKSEEGFLLCMRCRGTFTEAQATGNCCPRCGNRGLPGDTRKKSTLTLTDSEWRVLFIWADRWATDMVAKYDKEGYDSPATIRAIAAEARRQNPTMPSLSLLGDVQEAATSLGKTIELHGPDGSQKVDPERKH